MEINPDIKILLIDEREDNLFSIEAVLSKDGYQFRRAKSGKEALKILSKELDFALILMNVQMPGLSGIETASLIYKKENLKHIPIIFIVGNDFREEYIFKGYEIGRICYIYKPIDPDLLRAKVSTFVDSHRKNHLLLAREYRLQKTINELEESVKQSKLELINKNAQFEMMNSQFKKINNDLDSFVYAASHDLKAPVLNIEGLLSTLVDCMGKEAADDKNVKNIFDMLEKSIAKFKLTIEDLTDITRIQKDSDLRIENINLVEAIEDVKFGIRELMSSSGAKIIIDIDDCSAIKFSKKNLNSILYNLISNAIKYKSPKRKIEIKIKTKIENNFIVLSVSDNGLGFNPHDKDKVFTMFKRLHGHVEGSGVGLYIVKRIMENCGGRIEVDTAPDKGSVFKVYFKMNSNHGLLSDALAASKAN